MTTEETLAALLGKIEDLQEVLAPASKKAKSTNWHLKFTEKEVSKMPKSFRRTFRIQGCTVHCRRREDGRHKNSYEIRYRRNGYNLSVSATDLVKVKQRFIEALHMADKNGGKMPDAPKAPTTFNEFAQYYFDHFRWRKVTERTKKNDLGRYNRYIAPHFASLPIKSISSAYCQALIDSVADKPKTAHEVFSLVNVIFNMAIRHNLISHNPCDIVQLDSYEKEHGKALTKDEERKLLIETTGTPYQLMFAVALYTGMRPNEYKTAVIDGDFIKCTNSKQKDGKVHYKRIPICPMLKPYIPQGGGAIPFLSRDRLAKHFQSYLPSHKLYDLRTTFYTRCQEQGVSDIARKLFMGHKLGGLADTYTDISDEYLIKEAQKLEY